MTTTTRPRTDTERREGFRKLARDWDDWDPAEREMSLRDLAHPALTLAQLRDTWDSYLGFAGQVDGLNGVPGAPPCCWESVDAGMTLPGATRTEAAADVVWGLLDADEDVLIYGIAPGGASRNGE